MRITRKIKGIFGLLSRRNPKNEKQKSHIHLSVNRDFESHMTKMKIMKTLAEYINGSCESVPYLFMDSLYIVNSKYMMSDFNRRKMMDKTGNEKFISSIAEISDRAVRKKMQHE